MVFHVATNVAANEPTVSAQPSTKTKSRSLKGKETSIGESIIIPKAIKIDAITISITKNGRKSKNPI
jgi:hypothetical protein